MSKQTILLIITFLCAVVFTIILGASFGTQNNNTKTDTIISVVRDTIIVVDNNEVRNLRQQLSIVRDSVQIYKDSIEYVSFKYNQQVILRDIKLARIKEYNRIAGQRNNIKYLRGWINRVLN